MADVFLSYSSQDKNLAAQLVRALQDRNFTVWWDQMIPPGSPYDDEINRQIEDSRCVLFIASRHSLESKWARSEALRALNLNTLLIVQADNSQLPCPFNIIEAVPLSKIIGSRNTPELKALICAIDSRAVLGGRRTNAVARRPKKSITATARITPIQRDRAQSIRLAGYNINNLFSRSLLDADDDFKIPATSVQDFHLLERLLSEQLYTNAIATKISTLLEKFDFNKAPSKRKDTFFEVQQFRSRLYNISGGRIKLLAKGRSDWVGNLAPRLWAIPEIAVRVKRQAINVVAPDVVFLHEVEGAAELNLLTKTLLDSTEKGPMFSHNEFARVSSTGGIGILSKFPIWTQSAQCEIENSELIARNFSLPASVNWVRSVMLLPGRKPIYLYGIYQKDLGGRPSKARQTPVVPRALIEDIAERNSRDDLVAVSLSLIGRPAYQRTQQLRLLTRMRDIREWPGFSSEASFERVNQIDTILMSNSLWEMLVLAGAECRGVYGASMRFADVAGHSSQASSHCAVYADVCLN